MKSKKNLLLIGSILCIVVVAAIFMLRIFNQEPSYRVIKLIETSGDVSIIRSNLGSIKIYEDMRLEDNDKLIVNDNSSAYLSLGEDKYLYVEENSELSIVGTKDNTGSIQIKLDKGSIVNEIQKPLASDASYTVSTPNSTMSVRGTVFSVSVNYDQNNESFTKLAVFDGKVASQLINEQGSLSEELIVETNYEILVHGDDFINEYVVNLSENGKTNIQSPIDYQKLSASSAKVLLSIMEHGQLPDIDLTFEELSEIVESKIEQAQAIELDKPLKVSYYDQHQNLVEIMEYDYNTFISLQEEQIEGYKFVGWYTDALFTQPIDVAFFVLEDLSLYPKYIEDLDTIYTIEIYDQQQDGQYSLIETKQSNGLIGDTVTIDAPLKEGFILNNSRSILKLTLKEENNIIKIYYDLPKVVYSVDGIDYEGIYGQTVTLKQGSRQGYHFVSFNTMANGLGQTISNEVKLKQPFSVYSIFEPNNDINYMVDIYLENLNGSYEYSETLIEQGIADSTVEWMPKSILGFTAEKQVYPLVIHADGSAKIEVRYRRNLINYSIDGHTYQDKYGAQITLVSLNKQGYDFKGYFPDANGGGTKLDDSFILQQSFRAYSYFEPRDDIDFKINIYHQNIENDSYTFYQSINLKGVADHTISYSSPSFVGFKPDNATHSIYIKADGTGSLDIYYQRKMITYTLDGVSFTAKYGSLITLDEPSKQGYQFVGFNTQKDGHGYIVENPFVLKENIDIYSIFSNHEVNYTVINYYENLEDDGYFKEILTYTALAGSVIKYNPLNTEGYITPQSQEFYINEDGSSQVEFVYQRKRVSYTLNGSEPITVKYGTKVTVDSVLNDKVFIRVYELIENNNKIDYAHSNEFNIIKNCNLFTEYLHKNIVTFNYPNGNVKKENIYGPLFTTHLMISGYNININSMGKGDNDGVSYHEVTYVPLIIRLHLYDSELGYHNFIDFNSDDITQKGTIFLNTEYLIQYLSAQGYKYTQYYKDESLTEPLDNGEIYTDVEGGIVNIYSPKESVAQLGSIVIKAYLSGQDFCIKDFRFDDLTIGQSYTYDELMKRNQLLQLFDGFKESLSSDSVIVSDKEESIIKVYYKLSNHFVQVSLKGEDETQIFDFKFPKGKELNLSYFSLPSSDWYYLNGDEKVTIDGQKVYIENDIVLYRVD